MEDVRHQPFIEVVKNEEEWLDEGDLPGFRELCFTEVDTKEKLPEK